MMAVINDVSLSPQFKHPYNTYCTTRTYVAIATQNTFHMHGVY